VGLRVWDRPLVKTTFLDLSDDLRLRQIRPPVALGLVGGYSWRLSATSRALPLNQETGYHLTLDSDGARDGGGFTLRLRGSGAVDVRRRPVP
jgi:hypothetical protein